MEEELAKPIEKVLSRLENVQPCGEGYSAICPAHADSRPSLSVSEGEAGKVVIHCHTGCAVDRIVSELGLELSDLFPSRSTLQPKERRSRNNGTPVSNAADCKPATGEAAKTPVFAKPKLVTAKGSDKDWAALTKRYEEERDAKVVEMLAGELSVSADALHKLHVGWNEREKCYTFPERSARGAIVGINCRSENGEKKAIKGSKRGLTMPEGWADGDGQLLIPEGASDVAAALTMGLAVVGRPSATGGLKSLIPLLRGFPTERDIVVVGEMDAKDDGRWPGKDAAEELADELASELDRPVQWCLPPDGAKDIRQWLGQQDKGDDPQRLGEVFLEQVTRHEFDPDDAAPRIEFIDTHTLETTEYRLDWLVKHILVAGQPCIVGGPKKSLKTNTLIDLAVSLGSGFKFLNAFEVAKPVRVGMICGESGEATTKETYLRIRRAKIDCIPGPTSSVDVRWAFRLPQLGTAKGRNDLEYVILEQELKVVILDPIYLALLAGNKDVQASNLFQMGPLLADVAGTCLDAGATPIFVHHNTKAKNFNFEVPELEDLAFAGVQEFARQWMLLGRREKYEPGTNEHKLWLNVGGAAGFSGCWALDIEEGTVREDFTGRKWDVTVIPMFEQRDADKAAKRKAKDQKEREERDEAREMIRRVLRNSPDGETPNRIAGLAGMGKPKAERLLAAMCEAEEVVKVEIMKAGGRGKRSHPGYRLAEPVPTDQVDVEEIDDDVEDDDAY